MKKVIFTLLSACVIYFNAGAQACGNSGPSICTPSGTLTEPGLSPASMDLPSVTNGDATPTLIQFKNFNQFVFGGQTVTVQTLKIDSINNIPAGLCWATSKSDNTYANQEDGCIKVSGTPCSDPGQYKLKIIVTANIGVPIQTDADAAGLKYFVRCKNQGDADVAVDTNVTAAFVKLSGYSASASCGSSINETTNGVSTLNVAPNPFNSKAVVSFIAAKSGSMTERITNMLGSEVYRNVLEVRTGENTSMINRSDLPAGVYFYSLTDGKNAITRRIVISE